MATLTRPKTISSEQSNILLASTVPSPFPRAALEQQPFLQQNTANASSRVPETVTSAEAVVQSIAEPKPTELVQEIIPSIANVQMSCLMILNDLVPCTGPWQAIIPNGGEPGSSASPTSALHTLVSNLRNATKSYEMTEVASSNEITVLLVELGKRVKHLVDLSSLFPLDAELALSLVSLLAHLDRFSTLRSQKRSPSPSANTPPIDASFSMFDTLQRTVGELQVYERTNTPSSQTPALQVESALLWSRIDSDLEHVLSLCRQRSETLSPKFPPGLDPHPQHPPDYEYEDDIEYEMPPQYTDPESPTAYSDMKNPKARLSMQQEYHHVTSAQITNEKMKLDLEAVALAIDRLYLVAPQLHNQRVELKQSKVQEMEKARLAGNSSVAKGKQRQDDMKDLDEMLELIGKSSQRRLLDQSVVLEGGLEAMLERSKRRNIERRREFVEQLASHSDVGRLHDQDAVLNPSRVKSPDALLTLPEFMRESMPPGVIQADPQVILTLPEFMKEPMPPVLDLLPIVPTPVTASKRLRSRSMSAPSLAWIFGPTPKSPSPGPSEKRSHRRKRPGTSSGSISVSSEGLDLHYVAEHHENLQHVMVFLNITGSLAGFNLEAEILSGTDTSERLVLTCGSRTSSPVRLPARLAAGKKEVKVQSGHFELKLPTIPSSSSEYLELAHTSLFDAASLAKCAPTSFICSSCSLPLVQSGRVSEYKDLPSEHWEELVDAWMCHTDQKLHEHVMKHASNGFWPMEGQALVGGSYIVFEKGSVVEGNLVQMSKRTPEDWDNVRCICGAAVGRCQKPPIANKDDSMVYRLVKYAIRPVSRTVDPTRIPLSAFIVEDMQEYVHAHATYRFVLYDEDEELPRILVWLFKPSIQIAYITPESYTMPKSGCIHAAKVLFKLLGPTADLDSVVAKYPGFPQAERLSYPLNICRRLAALLKESNAAYPESMRQMTGLDVGFLQRA